VQVVHAELDYLAPVPWRHQVRVADACDGVGTTSFTLRFEVLRRDPESSDGVEQLAVRGHNVYVVVSTTDWAKREIPYGLREALISVAAQGLPPQGTV
jgi:acyl-CoA thioester hydrolase